MAINAGTVMAYMDMDTSAYNLALQSAKSQAQDFARDGGGISGMLDGAGAAMTAAGTTMTMGVTAPLLAIGTAAVGVGMTFDVSMSKVAALSGTTGEKFDQLRNKALEMGSSTKYTASEAADAMGYMALAGWDADQMMAGLPGVLNLAAASGMDLARASDIVTDTMTPFRLAASESARVSDIFAKAQATSNTTVEMLGEAMKYAAPNADAFGMSLEQTSAVLGFFANSGIKGSMGGTTFTAMLNDMKNAMKDGAIAIGDMNIAMVDAQGNYREFPDIMADIEKATYGMSESERDAALSAVFQTRGMKGVLAILSQGSGTLAEYTEELENSSGAAEEMSGIMQDNLKGDLTILKSGIEGAAVALSDWLTPALRRGTQWITSAVSWFNGLDKSIKNTVFRIGGIAAAIGPALLVGGKLVSAFSGILPIAGLLAGGFTLVYRNSERLQAFVQTTRDSIPGWIDGIKTGFETFTAALDDGQGTLDAAQSALQAAFGPGTAGNIGRTMRAVASGFRLARGYIDNGINGLGEFFGSLIDGESTADALRQALETAFGADFARNAEGAITRIDAALNAVKSTAASFAAGTRIVFTQLWDGIGTDFETGGLMGVLTGLGGRLYDALITGAELARDGAVTVRERIADGLSMARDWLAPKAQVWMGNLGSAYQSAVSYATDKLPTVKDAILNGLTATKETVTAKAQDVMTWLGNAYRSETVQGYLGNLSGVATTIWSKIQLGKTALTDKAAEWLNKLGTALGSEEAKAKVTEITGVVSTIAKKIVSGAGAWKLTAGTLIGDLIAQLTDNGFLETAVTGLGDIVTAIADGIGAAAENITGCAATLIGKLTDKFAETGFIEGVFTKAGDVVTSIGTALANAAGNIATAATDLAGELLKGLAAVDWGTIFTQAGDIVGSIAGVLSDNAANIGTAALDLAGELLSGLAGVDWATISYNLGVALGNLVTAIADWFSVEGNRQQVIDAGKAVAGGLVEGIGKALEDEFKYAENMDFSPMENATNPKYIAKEYTDAFYEAYKNGLQEGVEPTKEQMAIAVGLIGEGYYAELLKLKEKDLPVTAADLFNNLWKGGTLYSIKQGFADIGFTITDSLASAIGEGKVNVVDALFALGAGMDQELIASMDQMALREYLANPSVTIDPTVTVDETNLQTSTNEAVNKATQGTGGYQFTNTLPLDIDPNVSIDNTKIQTEAQGVIDTASTTITNGKDTVTTAAQGTADAIATPFAGLPEETRAQAALMLTSVNAAITEGTPEATAAIETAANAVLDKAKLILNEAAGHTIGSTFLYGIQKGTIAVQSALNATVTALGILAVNAIASVMSTGTGYGIGQSMIQAVIDGAGSMAGALMSRMESLARSAVSAFKSGIRMASPPRAFVEIGEAIPAAVGFGTDNNRDAALQPMMDLADDMAAAFHPVPEDANMTDNPHSVSVGGGNGNGGGGVFNFNFTGDITVREDADIERVSQQLFEDIQSWLRGGGAFA